eukprot:CAMPEP_0197538462 /NCGR_PEP_ID=MMETSP1318-20131121/59735_1 /TAXON_ID=552666 /ORGANISM="Partenskyella glossopodia, Strain RCC365" /LENGTH=2527 /DNA_ID=CAMNT_0043096877 /DNA_START=151 /DNA_END=7734 /DNA_ORIENTATION=+
MPQSPGLKKRGDDDKKTIVGRAANPLNKENWEDDFDLPNSLHLDETGAAGYLSTVPKPLDRAGPKSLWSDEKRSSKPSLEELDDPFAHIDDFPDLGDTKGGGQGGDGDDAGDIALESGAFDDDDESEDWDKLGEATAGFSGEGFGEDAKTVETDIKDPDGQGGTGTDGTAEAFAGFGDDSEDEDWTNFEEDIHGEEPTGSFVKLELEEGDDEQDNENNVLEYSLIKKLLSEQATRGFNIIKYPEPPQLYSSGIVDNNANYQDEHLVDFLQGLPGLGVEGGEEGDGNAAGDETTEEKQNQNNADRKQAKKHVGVKTRPDASKHSSSTHSSGTGATESGTRNQPSHSYPKSSPKGPLHQLFEIHENDTLPVVITKAAKTIRRIRCESPEHVAVIVNDCHKYIQSNITKPNVTLYRDHRHSAENMYSILHATAQHQPLHPFYIRTAITCFPTHAPKFNLLNFESKAHHDGTVADLLLQSFCQIYATQKKFTDQAEAARITASIADRAKSLSAASLFPPKSSSSGSTPKAGEGKKPRASISANETRKDKNEEQEEKLRIAYEVQARALASLHLYLENRSPLDWKELSRKAQYDPLENPGFEWLLDALYGKPPKESSDEQFRLIYLLCGNDTERMSELQKVYAKIKSFDSLAKAQSAFALARYLSEGNISEETGNFLESKLEPGSRTKVYPSARVAEELAFECVVILSNIEKKTQAVIKGIRSRMGVTALVLLGDILNANSKYQYAVHAFESAISIYQEVTKQMYYEMINTLSTLCEKHDDWQRALKYHLLILEKAKLEGNLNMYVYIVQQISKIHTKAGDFLNAVKHLRSAIEVLNQCIKEKQSGPVRGHHQLRGVNVALDVHNRNLARLQGLNSSRKTDFFPGVHMQEVRNQKVNIYLRLAQHFLDAKRIIEAIVVLEFLLEKEGKLPRGKISVVHLLLATAYTKKRLYGCSKELINHMQKIAREKKDAPSFNIPGDKNVSFNAEFTPILGVSPSEVVKTREFVALVAKTEFSLGNFSNARIWTDVSMRMSVSNPASLTLGQRGNLHYRMGKILQGVSFKDLGCANLGNKDEKISHFPNTGECMTQFDIAYNYFEKVEDHVHIAKTLARIVESYLHVAFTSVGLLGQPPSSLENWLESAGFRPEGADPSDPKLADIIWDNFLNKIERPAFDSLDVALSTYHPVLYLKCLVNVAEIRFLQGKYEGALKFWRECKNTFFSVLMNSERCVMVDRATPGMTSNIHSVFHRLVRLLICFHPDMINKNLVLMDSYNLHTIELFADVEQCSPLRLWSGGAAAKEDRGGSPELKASQAKAKTRASAKPKGGKDSTHTGLRKQRLLHMRGIRDDVDIFMNNDTEVMLETRRWLRQRKTPEPLTQEKHWRKHLSAFMGAVGSRSMSKSLHHDLAGSMMYDNYLDRDSYKSAIELRDKVCSLFYQISLNFAQATAGRFSQKELVEKNRADLHSILRNMDQLRNLTYHKSGRPGGIAGAFSPHRNHNHHNSSRRAYSRRTSSVWMSEFSQNHAPYGAASGGGGSTHPPANSDPLWSTLTYCMPLGNAFVMYSPQLKVKMVRMVKAGKPIQGLSETIRIDPQFLCQAFDDFIKLQNRYRKAGRATAPMSNRDVLFQEREAEIKAIGKRLGMLASPGAESAVHSKVGDLKSLRDQVQVQMPHPGIDDIEEAAVAVAAPTPHSETDIHKDYKNDDKEMKEGRRKVRRLPSNQFLADEVDEINSSSKDQMSVRARNDMQRDSADSEDKQNTYRKVGSLYDVLDDLQGISSQSAVIKTPIHKDRKTPQQLSPRDGPEQDQKQQTVGASGTVGGEEAKEDVTTRQTRTGSEVKLARLEMSVACRKLPSNVSANGSQGEKRLVLEVFSSREQLCRAESEPDMKLWKPFSFIVNVADSTQMLWFVVRLAQGKQSGRNPMFVGQNHVALDQLLAARTNKNNKKNKSSNTSSSQHVSQVCVDLEDKSRLNSQPDLLASIPKTASIVCHSISLSPLNKMTAQDDPLMVKSLVFPDKGSSIPPNISSSEQVPVNVVEKLIPPSFDLMLIKELLAALDRQNILALLSGMFNDCQIILTSQNNFRLKAAINCLLRLMYPFHWQHTLVPLLPKSCVGMLRLKQPYIIAVNQFVFPSCIDLIPPKAIVAFLDHNQIRIRPGSFIAFPSSIKNRLSTAIQQFRVMLFRSLVTNKPHKHQQTTTTGGGGPTTAGANGGDGSKHKHAASASANSGRSSLEIKVPNTPTDGIGSTGMGRYRMASHRALAQATAARPELSLQILKRHFLNCFVTLFYKIRLHWTGNPSQPLDVRGFLKATNPEYRPFIHNFVRTQTFGRFIEVRASLSIDQHSPRFLFDEMVYRRIYDKYRKVQSLSAMAKKGKMLCQKGKGRWKMRSVEVVTNMLNVYKYNKRKGAKYTRVLKPGWFQIDVPEAQVQDDHFTFELRNVWEQQKDDSTLTFRVNTDRERREWVKAIEVRIMDNYLRAQYEFIVGKFGKRFADADERTQKKKTASKVAASVASEVRTSASPGNGRGRADRYRVH